MFAFFPDFPGPGQKDYHSVAGKVLECSDDMRSVHTFTQVVIDKNNCIVAFKFPGLYLSYILVPSQPLPS